MSDLYGSKKPVLIMIRGLPGSGKSYLANALKKAIGDDKVVTLDPDTIDKNSKDYVEMATTLTSEGVDEKLFPYRYSRGQAYKGIEENKVVMWNQAFTNLDGFNKTIINLQTYAADHGTELPVLVVEVEIGHDTAKNRVAERASKGGHDVPADAFDRFINDYKTFANEGHNVVVVNGDDDINESVTKVTQAMQKLA